MKLIFVILNFFGIFLPLHCRTYHNMNFKIGYNFAIIADQDKKAIVIPFEKFRSFFYPGHLYVNKQPRTSLFSTELILVGEVTMDKSGQRPVESSLHVNITNKNDGTTLGRGMELSELLRWNGKLYTMDDKTGIVFELVRDGNTYQPKPWATLISKNEKNKPKEFKCEWATIKDGKMYVGSHGSSRRETSFVFTISSNGTVDEPLDWTENYNAMMSKTNFSLPGYIAHEAAQWSPKLNRWIFIPRKTSHVKHTDKTDETAGANIIIIADESFNKDNIVVKEIHGTPNPLLGVSSFKIIPGFDDRKVVALRTKEVGDIVETYITAYDLDGNILHPDELIEDKKYEGFEFLNEDDKRR